jgi:hypothetical protein
MRVDEQYLDVLQNIEFAIVSTYRRLPGMTDQDVLRVLEVLIGRYKAEQERRAPREVTLSDIEQRLLGNVHSMCEWRLGRSEQMESSEDLSEEPLDPLTLDEILLCLKKILHSARGWNERRGHQGYLSFIVKYVR